MTQDLISKYIWIVDTLKRYKSLSRERINTLWMRSSVSDGRPLPERTFHHYRRGIEQNFHIDIHCDRKGEYYIDESKSRHLNELSNWIMDSMAVTDMLKESREIAEQIEVEEVPSARAYLPTFLEALRNCEKVTFTHAGFTRSRPDTGIRFQPHLLKRYKQRWYVVGIREGGAKGGEMRTYALDRVRDVRILPESFERPDLSEAEEIFSNIIGISSSRASVRDVRLRATPRQAKYFRALPLHKSQREEIHDEYSIFSYRLKLNYELVSEILALGDAVKVLDPPELRAMVTTRLRDALAQYRTPGTGEEE